MTTRTPTTVPQLTAAPLLIPLPYTVVCDTREQRSYAFATPLRIGTKLYAVRTIVGTLQSGDYSIVGYTEPPGGIAIERKSLADAFGTFGRGRERFERELVRLSAYRFAAVVVEAEWSTVLTAPPARSKLRPRSVLGSVVAWQCRFPNVQWIFLPGRDVAEAYTARLLDRFWREQQAKSAIDAIPEIEDRSMVILCQSAINTLCYFANRVLDEEDDVVNGVLAYDDVMMCAKSVETLISKYKQITNS